MATSGSARTVTGDPAWLTVGPPHSSRKSRCRHKAVLALLASVTTSQPAFRPQTCPISLTRSTAEDRAIEYLPSTGLADGMSLYGARRRRAAHRKPGCPLRAASIMGAVAAHQAGV